MESGDRLVVENVRQTPVAIAQLQQTQLVSSLPCAQQPSTHVGASHYFASPFFYGQGTNGTCFSAT